MDQNAYAAVIAPREGVGTSHEALLAYAGTYYVEKWKPLIAGTNRVVGFNIYAAIFGMAWFFYRKMYGLGLAVFLAGVVVSYLSGIAYALIVRPPLLDNTTLTFFGLVSLVVFVRIPIGIFANVLYYKKAAKAVRQAATAKTPNDYLKAQGGVSVGGAFLAVVMGLAFRLLIQAIPVPSKETASPADAPRLTSSTAHRDAGVIRHGLYINEVVGIEVPIPDGYRAATYTELKAQWEQSQRWLDLSEEERKTVKNQFHSNDILNLQGRPDAPAYANLRIIATPQSPRDPKPLTAQQQASEYLAQLGETETFGNARVEMKSERPEQVSKGGREYYTLRMALVVPAFKARLAQVALFTTHRGFNLVIVIAAMEAEDAEFLTKLVEQIKYKNS